MSGVEWSGVEWSGVEWSGVEWSGVEWSGVEWSGVEWSGVEWSGVEHKVTKNRIATIECTRLRWYGHVIRTGDDRLSKKYFTWVPERSRSTGRPRKRWIDGLKTGPSRRNPTLEEIEHLKLYEDKSTLPQLYFTLL